MASRPREAGRQLGVGLRSHDVALRSASRERTRDDDAALGGHTGDGVPLVAEQQPNLTEQRRTDHCLLRVGDLLLVVVGVGAGRRERGAAHAPVTTALVLVVRPKRDRRRFAHLERQAAGRQGLPVRLSRHFLDGPRRTYGVDDCLLVLGLIAPGHLERHLAAVSGRPAERALDDVLPVRRLLGGKRVPGVEGGVAPEEVALAVELRGRRLGQDLDPPATGARVLGGIRVLVDLDLLHGGGADTQRVHLHPVHHQGHAPVAQHARVEETRGRGDHVLVEHGQALEHVLVDGDRIGVGRGTSAHLTRLGVDGDLLAKAGQRQRQADRSRRACPDRHARGARLEPFEAGQDVVAAWRHRVEPKHAGGVGGRGACRGPTSPSGSPPHLARRRRSRPRRYPRPPDRSVAAARSHRLPRRPSPPA